MAETITDGNLDGANSRVSRSYNYDQMVLFRGENIFNNVTLAIGVPTGTAQGDSYTASASDTFEMNDSYLTITNRTSVEGVSNNRNNTFRFAGGVTVRRTTIVCEGRGGGINNRIGFGSPNASTEATPPPMVLEDDIFIANTCRMIMQLPHFTPTLNRVAIDDFTFTDSRADWNMTIGVFTGLESGTFDSSGDTQNGNMSGSNGATINGTITLPDYVVRRIASSGETPTHPHRTSLKGCYLVFLDATYQIIDSDGAATVVIPTNLNEWNNVLSSSDTASGQRAAVGTGGLAANRFAVEMRNAVGGIPQGLRTWITNANNSAFNDIQCYNLTDGLTTSASTNTNGRPSVRPFTLSTPLIDNAVVAVSIGVTDTVESLTSGVIPYNIGADYGFVTSVYGYSKVSVQDVNPIELNILRRLSGQELNYVVPVSSLFSQDTTSLNSAVSRFHNTDIIQAPLVAAGWSVDGSTLNLGSATVAVGDTTGTFGYTTGDNAIVLPFDVLQDTRTANESGIGGLLTLNRISAANVEISGEYTGAIGYTSTTQTDFTATATLTDGDLAGPTANLVSGVSLGGANTLAFNTINGWAIQAPTNQTFVGTTAINTTNQIGVWADNTFASTTINVLASQQPTSTEGQFNGVASGLRYLDVRNWDNSGVVTIAAGGALQVLITQDQADANEFVAGTNVTLATIITPFTRTYQVPLANRNGTFTVKNMTTGNMLVNPVVIDPNNVATYSFGIEAAAVGTDTYRFIWRPNSDATVGFNTTITDFSQAVDGAITFDQTTLLVSNPIVARLWVDSINTDVGIAAMNLIVDGDEDLNGVDRAELQFVNSLGILDDPVFGTGRTIFVGITALNDDIDYIIRICNEDLNEDYIVSNGTELGINGAYCYPDTGDNDQQTVTSLVNINNSVSAADFLPKTLPLTSGGTAVPAIIILSNPAGASASSIQNASTGALNANGLTPRNMKAAVRGGSFKDPDTGDLEYDPQHD